MQSIDALDAVNGPNGIFSVWVLQADKGGLGGFNGSVAMLSSEDGQSTWVSVPGGGGTPDGHLYNGGGLQLYSDGYADSYNIDTMDDIVPTGVWAHGLLAWSMDYATGSRRAACYVDDVLYPMGDEVGQYQYETGGPFDIKYNDTRFYIGNYSTTTFFFGGYSLTLMTGDIADMYFNTDETIVEADNTISEENRRKFRSAEGKPVDLGADGSTPTGSTPRFFLKGNATSFADNLAGTGGFEIRRVINTTGHNGAGSVTAPGAVAGERVFNVFDWSNGDVSADFESVISVDGQIQQIGASDYSAERIVISLPGSLTDATTSPSD